MNARNSYEDLKEEYVRLKSIIEDQPENFSIGLTKDIFALASELLRQQEGKRTEQEILMKTRGVFKYVTSCYYKDNTSTKNALVQVGYLDLDDNIVFNEPDREFIGKLDTLVRYLPGFWVRGYRSCEEYVPSIYIKGGGTEVREVISEHIIKYSPSTYGSSPKVVYSVIGYLEDDGELIYYNQIANKE